MIRIESIEDARRRLEPVIIRTPLVPSPNLGRLVGADIHLKLENLQRTGSFKFRGGYVKVSRLLEQNPGCCVTAASAGNHAQGVALAARLLGLKSTIFMPVNASLSKQEATSAYGATLRLEGENVEESLAAAKAMPGDHHFIHPYDDEDIISGQGTIGLEILDDLPGVDAVLVPLGGGGLLAGVASAIKARAPHVAVIGVEPDRAASGSAALRSGRPVDVVTKPTLADGTRVARIGDLNLPAIQGYVDDVVQVKEEHIARAMLLLLERRRIISEGAGALPLAAFLAGLTPQLGGKKVVLVISGGNVDANLIGRIIDQGLVRSGRIFRFSVVLDDAPGSLSRLLAEVASTRANVMHIHHDRLGKKLPISATRVGLELETRGFDHAGNIAQRLRDSGYIVTEE